MPLSDAKKKAIDRYHRKFDEIKLRVPKEFKSSIASHAKSRDESMTQFIIRAIRNQMERDRQDK